MKDRRRRQVNNATARILAPLVRLLMHHGIAAGELAWLCKQAFVQAAASRQKRELGRINQSRIAIVTGLTRAEVKRLLAPAAAGGTDREWHIHRAARVLSGWRKDRAFHDKAGRPRALPLPGKTGSFAALVRRYAGDIPPRAMLDELVAGGHALLTPAKLVRLQRRVPGAPVQTAPLDEVAQQASRYLGLLVSRAMGSGEPHFEITVRSNTLDPGELPLLMRDLRARGGNLMASLDEAMRLASRPRTRQRRKRSAALTVTLFAAQGDE